MSDNELTTTTFWNKMWSKQSLTLHSRFSVNTRNVRRILRKEIKSGMKVLELGCAPGKHLAWVAKELHADVSGVDYSEQGMIWTRKLFETLNLTADLRYEDIFNTSLPKEHFDVVYSLGLVEHFADPREIVRTHLALTRPQGTAVIVIPNWGDGLYGTLQRYFDPEDLKVHNTSIMNASTLAELAPAGYSGVVTVTKSGRFNFGSVYFERKWPYFISRIVKLTSYGIGSLQFFDIPALCPFYTLTITHTADTNACRL
jgi:2-polyprenyl-3-methyl-5-hydroxy-6-metoxy-1,4-benzoquinol methylase